MVGVGLRADGMWVKVRFCEIAGSKQAERER